MTNLNIVLLKVLKMKNLKYFISICIIIIAFIFLSFEGSVLTDISYNLLQDSASNYMDGNYKGESRASYTAENYWGHVSITVEEDMFTEIDFFIRDSSRHEFVDSMYGVNHYSDNLIYFEQCMNEDKAIKIYPQSLIESQDLDNVDAITGATWSYEIFMASTKDALKDAKKPTSIDEGYNYIRTPLKLSPNPFYESLTLEYDLPDKCYVNISIFNVEGKMVKQLIDQVQFTGSHSLQWKNCPSPGVYYCAFQVNDCVNCYKILNVKGN